MINIPVRATRLVHVLGEVELCRKVFYASGYFRLRDPSKPSKHS